MNNHNNSQQQDAAEQAMNQVLAAEQAAEQAVAECESDAHAIIEDAQSRALRIAERTNDRIAILEQRCSQNTERRLRRVRQQEAAPGTDGAAQELDAAALRSVVEALAAQLAVPAKAGS